MGPELIASMIAPVFTAIVSVTLWQNKKHHDYITTNFRSLNTSTNVIESKIDDLRFDVAKNYLEESKDNVLSDVILMSVGLNRASSLYYSNPKRFKQIMRSEKILRRVDDVYLIDSLGNILISDVRDITEEFIIPADEDYDLALEGKPVFITDNLGMQQLNQSFAM